MQPSTPCMQASIASLQSAFTAWSPTSDWISPKLAFHQSWRFVSSRLGVHNTHSSHHQAVNLSGFFFGALVGLLSSTLGDIGLRLVIVAILLACGAVTVFYPEPSLHTPYQEILEDGQSEEVSLEFRGDVLDQSLVANNEQDSPGSARKLVNPSPWRRIVHFFTFEAWEPFASRDFCLVFASRFLFQVSIATLTQVGCCLLLHL